MFRVGNTSTPSAFTINSSGYIGINSTTPSASLALTGTSGINPFNIVSSTGTSLLSILQNGNVGIGTAVPGQILHVSSAGTNTLLEIESTNTTGNSTVYFVGTGSNSAYFGMAGTTDSLVTGSVKGDLAFRGQTRKILFSSDGGSTSALTVATNNNVGISTNSPSARLTVVGAGNVSSTLTFNTFSNSGTSTFKIDDAGNASFANDGLYYEASSSVSYINSFETGGLNFDDNAGLVSWVDMAISSTVAGTPNSYTASIGGSPMIMVYAESNGAGGIQNQ